MIVKGVTTGSKEKYLTKTLGEAPVCLNLNLILASIEFDSSIEEMEASHFSFAA